MPFFFCFSFLFVHNFQVTLTLSNGNHSLGVTQGEFVPRFSPGHDTWNMTLYLGRGMGP